LGPSLASSSDNRPASLLSDVQPGNIARVVRDAGHWLVPAASPYFSQIGAHDGFLGTMREHSPQYVYGRKPLQLLPIRAVTDKTQLLIVPGGLKPSFFVDNKFAHRYNCLMIKGVSCAMQMVMILIANET